MNIKLLIIGIIVVGGTIFAFIFANQFAFNQTELANTSLEVSTDNNGSATDAEVELMEETTAGLSTSTEPSSIESDLQDIDLSGLDSGLEDLNTEAQGL